MSLPLLKHHLRVGVRGVDLLLRDRRLLRLLNLRVGEILACLRNGLIRERLLVVRLLLLCGDPIVVARCSRGRIEIAARRAGCTATAENEEPEKHDGEHFDFHDEGVCIARSKSKSSRNTVKMRGFTIARRLPSGHL
jgi:hypothetical protein